MFKRLLGWKSLDLKKIFYLLGSFLFLFNSVYSPLYVLAEGEANQEPVTEESNQTVGETFVSELAPLPSPGATPSPTPSPTPLPTPTPIPTYSPTPTMDSAPTPEPPPAPAPTPEIWSANDNGGYTTSANVVVGTAYTAPQNSKVSVTFQSLPAESGTLTVKEIKLSSEEVAEIGALSDTAYEVTSTMEDETFEYDLTLPLPPQPPADLEVKIAETEEELGNAQTVTESTEQSAETITINSLTHFTVFVLVNDVDTDDPDNLGDSDDVANGVYAVLDDTWAGQGNPDTTHETSVDLNVRAEPASDQRTFINFDLSSVPTGAAVDKATLRLFLYNAPSSARTYEAYRITDGWTEDTITWNAQAAVAGTASSSVSTGTSDNVWREWDVTDDVSDYVSGGQPLSGWLIKDSDEDSGTSYQSQFRSGDYSTVLKRPQLIIDFAEAGQNNSYQNPVTDSASNGDGFEVNPTEAFDDGGNSAQNIDGSGESHLFYDYDFSGIPAGSQINGIEVRADWRLDATGGTNNFEVELSSDEGTNWTASKSDITETDKLHTVSFGGSTDTWGRSWSVSDLSTSNFRVRVTTNSTDADRDFYLDWIPVRVYYTPDTDKPSTVYSSTPADFTNNNFLTYEGTSTDDSSGIAYVEYQVINNDTSDVEINWTFADGDFDNELSEDFSFTTDFLSEGEYTVEARAADAAGNIESTATHIVTIDTTPPTVTSSKTQDTNGNGQLDAVELTFSENIDDSQLIIGTDDGWDIDGAGGESIDTGDSDDDNVLVLSFGEGPTPDTGNRPTVIYIPIGGGGGSTHDLAGNELEAYNGDNGIPDDGALPVLLTAITKDTQPNGQIDAIELTFSEDINDGLLDETSNDGWDVEGYDDEIIGSGTGENDAILMLSFAESGSPDTGTTPSVNYASSEDDTNTHDLSANSNELASLNVISTDGASPTGNWTAPTNGSTVNGTVALEVSAQDATAGVRDVVFSYSSDGVTFTDIDTDNNDGDDTYSVDWVTTGLTLGDYTLRAIITDEAGNSTTEDIVVGVSAVVSEENGASSSYGSATITWTTSQPTKSRVIYDTVSHPVLGAAPNYDYAFSTGTFDTDPKVTSHSVTLTGLSNGTKYYYRTVSEGSPVAVSGENSFQTLSTAGAPAPSGGGGAVLGASTTAFIAPLVSFFTPENVSAEEVLGEKTEELASPSPKPEVNGTETPNQTNKNWLWLLLVLPVLGLGYYYFNKKNK